MRFRLGVEHVFLVVGLAMLAGAWVAYDLTVRRPRTWPQTDALVVSSRVVNPAALIVTPRRSSFVTTPQANSAT